MIEKPKFPRRRWQVPEQMRAAYLAAMGHSAAEIAEMVGGTTGKNVAAILRVNGINLTPKHANDAFVLAKCKRQDRAALNDAADARGRPPEELAALIVRKVLNEHGLLDKLVDPFDVI